MTMKITVWIMTISTYSVKVWLKGPALVVTSPCLSDVLLQLCSALFSFVVSQAVLGGGCVSYLGGLQLHLACNPGFRQDF